MAEFDYVIVGAGSAGGVLANRLSADGSTRVLLIEAGGGGRHLYHSIPAALMFLIGNPKFDWVYPTEPDASLGGRVMRWAGGKSLGGSSSINGMVYVRGSRFDYDDWAANGCPGWSFDDVLPFFRKMETFEGPPSQVHGSSGPVGVAPPRELHPSSRAFIEALGELGFPIRDDYSDGDLAGVSECLATVRQGVRSSTRHAYIDEAAGRPNLKVLTGALAETLLFEGKRAVGVRVRRDDGSVETHRARAEVIVSCGAIQSPTLLMRSGIGPAEDLAAHGVPVVADLQGVGRNLQEHLGSGGARRLNIPTYNVQTGPADMLAHIWKFLVHRRGALASAAAQAIAYGRSDPALAEPDLQFVFVPLLMDYSAASPTPAPIAGASIGAVVCKPDARGRIRLRSAAAEDKPVIEHQMLESENDLRRAVAGLRIVEKMWETPPLSSLVAGRLSPAQPLQTDEEYAAHVRQNCGIGWHAAGTCKMGRDAAAVVDPTLRVRGVEGLRVADASIMPRITSGNTNAPTIMIGERASDLILSGA